MDVSPNVEDINTKGILILTIVYQLKYNGCFSNCRGY